MIAKTTYGLLAIGTVLAVAIPLVFLMAGALSLVTLFLSNVVTSIDIPALGYWESFWLWAVFSAWRILNADAWKKD